MNANRRELKKILVGATFLSRPGVSDEITVLRLDRDNVMREYGLTAQEWQRFLKREKTRYIRDKQAGRVVRFKGSFGSAKFENFCDGFAVLEASACDQGKLRLTHDEVKKRHGLK